MESPALVTSPVDLNRIYLHKTKRTVCEATEMKKKKTPHTPKPHPPRDSGAAGNSDFRSKLFITNIYYHSTGMLQVHDSAKQQSVRWKTSTQLPKFFSATFKKKILTFSVFLFFLFFVFALTIYNSWVCEKQMDPAGVESATSAFREVFSVAQIKKKTK